MAIEITLTKRSIAAPVLLENTQMIRIVLIAFPVLRGEFQGAMRALVALFVNLVISLVCQGRPLAHHVLRAMCRLVHKAQNVNDAFRDDTAF